MPFQILFQFILALQHLNGVLSVSISSDRSFQLHGFFCFVALDFKPKTSLQPSWYCFTFYIHPILGRIRCLVISTFLACIKRCEIVLFFIVYHEVIFYFVIEFVPDCDCKGTEFFLIRNRLKMLIVSILNRIKIVLRLMLIVLQSYWIAIKLRLMKFFFWGGHMESRIISNFCSSCILT